MGRASLNRLLKKINGIGIVNFDLSTSPFDRDPVSVRKSGINERRIPPPVGEGGRAPTKHGLERRHSKVLIVVGTQRDKIIRGVVVMEKLIFAQVSKKEDTLPPRIFFF